MNLLRVSLLGILLLTPGMLRADPSKALKIASDKILGGYFADDKTLSRVWKEVAPLIEASPEICQQIESSPGMSTVHDIIIWAAAREVDFSEKAFRKRYPHLADLDRVILVTKSLKGAQRVIFQSPASRSIDDMRPEMLYGDGLVPTRGEWVAPENWIGPNGQIWDDGGSYTFKKTAKGTYLERWQVGRQIGREPRGNVISRIRIEDTRLVPYFSEYYAVPGEKKLSSRYLQAISMPDTPDNRDTLAPWVAAHLLLGKRPDQAAEVSPLWSEVESLIKANRDLRQKLAAPAKFGELESRTDPAILWAAARTTGFELSTFRRKFPNLSKYGKVIWVAREDVPCLVYKDKNAEIRMLFGDGPDPQFARLETVVESYGTQRISSLNGEISVETVAGKPYLRQTGIYGSDLTEQVLWIRIEKDGLKPEYCEFFAKHDKNQPKPVRLTGYAVVATGNAGVDKALKRTAVKILRGSGPPDRAAAFREASELILAGVMDQEVADAAGSGVGLIDSLFWAMARKSEFDQENLRARFPFLMSYGEILYLSKAEFGTPRLIYQPKSGFATPRMLHGDSVQPQIAELVVPERWEGIENRHEKFGDLTFEETSNGPYVRRVFVSVPDKNGARSHDVGWIRVEASRLVPERLEVYRVPEGDFRKPENRIGTAVAILPGAGTISK